MTRRLLPLAAALTLVFGCTDAPTSPSGVGELTGTIRPGTGRSALVLEVSPASALDSLLVGPRQGDPGALIVHGPVQGRYLVLSESELASLVRFRAFVNRAIDPATVRLDVVETAAPDGTIDEGGRASVSFAR